MEKHIDTDISCGPAARWLTGGMDGDMTGPEPIRVESWHSFHVASCAVLAESRASIVVVEGCFLDTFGRLDVISYSLCGLA